MFADTELQLDYEKASRLHQLSLDFFRIVLMIGYPIGQILVSILRL